jgi:hypothetical protein
MRRTLASGVILVCALLLCATAGASQPLLSILSLYAEDDYLCVDFYLKNAIEKELLTSIKNGVPALLSYRVQVWEDRANWYDKLVKSMTFSYKIAFDNWDTVYCVDAIVQERTETGRAGNVADLIHLLCNQKKLKTCPMSELDRNSSYYVTISAAVQSLSAERVREVESWLGGQTDGDKQEAGGLLGFVVDLFTSNAKRADAKSNLFALEALAR